MGTGTGCIICALCKNINGLSGIAIDKSRPALHIAKRNIKQLSLRDKIKAIHADFGTFKSTEKFDIIVSNPPYIKYGDTRVNRGAQHDPKIALYAKNDGLYAYEQIAKNAPNLLKQDGKIYLEIGIGMANQVIKIFNYFGWKFERTEKDLAGLHSQKIKAKTFEHYTTFTSFHYQNDCVLAIHYFLIFHLLCLFYLLLPKPHF